MSQIKIYGQFSYDRSSQRELQFQTDIREIDLRRRVWHGEESEWGGGLGTTQWVGFIALYFRELQHLWGGDSPDMIKHYLPCDCVCSIWVACHHKLGTR